jgi:hypothetical protein
MLQNTSGGPADLCGNIQENSENAMEISGRPGVTLSS